VKLAYVVPRYGADIPGGAESAVRMLAERMATRDGWDVSVLTTCARDSSTWADEYEPGTTWEAGVRVERFRSASGRDAGFDRFSGSIMDHPQYASAAEQRRWVDLQGPRNPAVVEAAAASDADFVVFSPYLYHPTVHGVPAVGNRAVLHPAAHDEAPLRLPIYRSVFRRPRGLVFYTHNERRLTEQRFGVGATPQLVLGLGIEEHAGEEAAARQALGLGDRPYLLCVGRVDASKGTTLLRELFAEYKRRHPGPLALVLMGPVADAPDAHPDVLVPGPVPEDVKWGALRGAELLVSPSGYESFSLVVVEAWTAGTPVVVNARCGATREHCERSGGGLWFDGYLSFEAIVDRLLDDADLRATLARRGGHYVDGHFRWPALTQRYATFLERLARTA
jgi:glycosyltransferase involved in cell wall biosynthesis